MRAFYLTFISIIQSILFWIIFGLSCLSNSDILLLIILIVLLLITCIGSTRFRLMNSFKFNYLFLEIILTPISFVRPIVLVIVKLLDKTTLTIDVSKNCLDTDLSKKQKIFQFIFCYFHNDLNK